MVSKKVVQFPSKVSVQGYSFLCFGKVQIGAKAYLKTVGSEAYVQLPSFVAINEGCVYTCESLMEGVCVLDTVENRACLPSALGHTLQCLTFVF